MKHDKLVDIVKGVNIVIPIYIYKLFPKFNIGLDAFIFLLYLHNKGKKINFDVKGLSEEFSCEVKDVMQYISDLQSKKLIELKVVKNENNIIEEYVSLDFFYEKITMYLVEELNTKKKEECTTIFDILQSELGRMLTPIEIEIVKAWKESNYTDEIIKEAIKDAVYNGVANLRYIDKILYEWAKKGIKTKDDVEKSKKQFREKERTQKVDDLFDYAWLDESSDD